MGDLLISGVMLLYPMYLWRLSRITERFFSEERESIYLSVWVKKARNAFIDYVDIFDRSRTFTRVASSSDDYEGEFMIT